MKKFYCFISCILLTFLFSETTVSQYGWNHIGPFGGDIRVFSSDSLYIYAGTAGGGIYKSSNTGQSWIYVGLNSATIRAILPLVSGDIYAGTEYGMFKKPYSSPYFSRIPAFNTSAIRSLAVQNGDIYAGTDNGIYKSSDNGNTWNIKGLNSSAVRCIYVLSSGDILAGTSGQGIYKSSNNGNTWIASGLSNYMVRSLTSGQNGNIFAGTYGGVFKSTNNGSTWTLLGLDQTDVPQVAIKSNGQLFAAAWDGVYTSTNNGTTWLTLGFSESITWSVFIDISDNIFIGRDGEGIFKSTNNGTSWTESNYGIYAARIWAISFDSNRNIYTGVSGGAFKSSDNGLTFTRIFNSTTAGRVWSILNINDNDILIGTSKGVFRSTDQGSNWNNIGIPDQSVKALKRNSLGYLFAGTSTGVYRSTDNGSSWLQYSGGLGGYSVNDLEITSNNTIFAAVGGGSAVYKSTNHGFTWTASNSGISSTSASDIFIDVRGFIYVSAGSTVYKSVNNGSYWSLYGVSSTTSPTIYVDSLAHSFLGNLGDGIYYMPDTSLGWYLANIGPENLYISTLTGDRNGFVYAGTVGGSIYRSNNSYIPIELISFNCRVKESKVYLSWKTGSELNNKGFYLERRSLQNWEEITFIMGSGTTTETNSYYYDDNIPDPGKYFYRLKQVDYDGKFKYSSVISTEILPNGFKLMQNYPNPFNPFTVIKFTVPEDQKVQLIVYDFLGKEIKEIFNGTAEGKKLYEIEFTSEGLSSGIYYYKLIAGERTEIRKMILMK